MTPTNSSDQGGEDVIRMTSDEFDRAMTIQHIMRTQVWTGSSNIPVTEEMIAAVTRESLTTRPTPCKG